MLISHDCTVYTIFKDAEEDYSGIKQWCSSNLGSTEFFELSVDGQESGIVAVFSCKPLEEKFKKHIGLEDEK